MIIDSHCHLTYEPMSSSLDETIRRANNDGVKYLLTISTEDKGFKNILDIVENQIHHMEDQQKLNQIFFYSYLKIFQHRFYVILSDHQHIFERYFLIKF